MFAIVVPVTSIRGIALVVAGVLIGPVSAGAEQAEPRLERLVPEPPAQPELIIRTEDLFPLTPPKRIGMFTIVPPRTNGEVVRLSIPIGELTMKSVRAISEAHRRREERHIEERIARERQSLLTAR